MVDHPREGGVLLVTRLDRLARSNADVLQIAELLCERSAGLRSMAEAWADTTTPAGRMILTVFAGIADFECSLVVELTSHGRQAARARGVRFGPRPSLTSTQIAHARELSKGGNRSLKSRNCSVCIVRRFIGPSVQVCLLNPLIFFGAAGLVSVLSKCYPHPRCRAVQVSLLQGRAPLERLQHAEAVSGGL